MVTVSSDKGKLDNGVASQEDEEKPKKAKKAAVVVVHDDTVPCHTLKVVPVGCHTGNAYQTVTPVIAEPRFKGTWDEMQQKVSGGAESVEVWDKGLCDRVVML